MDEGEFTDKCREKLNVLIKTFETEIISEKIILIDDGNPCYWANVRFHESEANYISTCFDSPFGLVAHMDMSKSAPA